MGRPGTPGHRVRRRRARGPDRAIPVGGAPADRRRTRPAPPPPPAVGPGPEAGEVRASTPATSSRDPRPATRRSSPRRRRRGRGPPTDGSPGPGSEALVAAKVAQAAPDLAREKGPRPHPPARAQSCAPTPTAWAFPSAATSREDQRPEAAVTTYATSSPARSPDLTDDERRVLAVFLLVCGRAQTPAQAPGPAIEAPQTRSGHQTRWSTWCSACTPTPAPTAGTSPGRGPRPGHETWLRDVLGPAPGSPSNPSSTSPGQAPVDAYRSPTATAPRST